MQRLGGWVMSSPWVEVLVFLVLAAIYLYNSASLTFPAGYAGLYALMSEGLTRQPLPLPSEIPYYGPGGIPFAYPPLGAYLAALFIGPLRVPLFDYLRWAPAIVTLLSMVALYFVGRQLLGDRLKALVAVVVASCAEITYVYHARASGMVRSLALLWALLGAYFALRAFAQRRRWLATSLLAGLCLALAVMTHLAYAVFLGLAIPLMAIFAAPGRDAAERGKVLGVILLSGLILSAPWWGTALGRYGTVVFFKAAQTHGTLDLFEDSGGSPLAALRLLLRGFVNFGLLWWPTFLAALSLAGLAYAVANGRWLLPVWMLAVFVVLGEADRFEILLSGLLIGDLLVDISRMARGPALWRISVGTEKAGGLVFLAIVLVPILVLGFRGIQWTEIALSGELVEASHWIAANVPPESRYLYVGENHDVGEWLPYLTRRTPGIGFWGAEWTGDYKRQVALEAEMSACAQAQQLSCVDRLISTIGADVQLLVVPAGRSQLRRQISRVADWEEVFSNGGYAVYQARR